MFQQLKQGLAKTRGRLSSGLKSLLLGKNGLDDDLLEDIEMQLLSSDLGVDATSDILKNLKIRFESQGHSDQLLTLLQEELELILQSSSAPLRTQKQNKPFVILTVGVNGVGKTTTIGKLT